MRRMGIIFLVLLGIVFFANTSVAGTVVVPFDMGAVQIVLTPTTFGEEVYTYILQCTYMGNNHYSLCGKATHDFGFILDGKEAPPGYVHTKVVHGNAELAGNEIVIYLQEIYGAVDPIPIMAAGQKELNLEVQKELNSAAVRIVINPSLLAKQGITLWTGTYTAINTRYYVPGEILDKHDREGSPFSQQFIEGDCELTIPAP
ncbi:MAG: hypothetical protein JXA35_11450 [Deltaproteobacteria bacterium]|nr:hypothetical protein [Deltaproteobacteria bacterium]